MEIAHHTHFFDRLAHLAQGAIEPLNIQKTPHIQDHEFVQEVHHDHILAFLTDFAYKHPLVAKQMAENLLGICERIIRSPSQEAHHKNAAQALKNKIHGQILSILNTAPVNTNLPNKKKLESVTHHLDFALREEMIQNANNEIFNWVHNKIEALKTLHHSPQAANDEAVAA